MMNNYSANYIYVYNTTDSFNANICCRTSPSFSEICPGKAKQKNVIDNVKEQCVVKTIARIFRILCLLWLLIFPWMVVY
jgi:hypothetical protein